MIQKYLITLCLFLSCSMMNGQEANGAISFDIPSQNALKFNRFLMNPTFSFVREDHSYVNFFHRNQWIQFDNSPQIYFLNYSGRINDKNGIGFGLYQQKIGVISSFGALVNYAYGIQLSEKNTLTFGFNMAYYNSGLDNGAAFPGMPDPALQQIENNSLLSFQPAINLSLGSFDIGVYGENLVDYNLKTGKSLTEFSQKTFSGHLMYTHRMANDSGKLTAMARARSAEDVAFGGSMLLDYTKLGWVQGGYDEQYGIAGGIGFNITNRMSIGYTYEQGLKKVMSNLGPTHEIVFAYSFQPKTKPASEKVAAVAPNDTVIKAESKELQEIKNELKATNMMLEELLFRQDSIAKAGKQGAANGYNNSNATNTNSTSGNTATTQPKTAKKNSSTAKNNEAEEFSRAAQKGNIRQGRLKDISGVQRGYYLVANVYKNKKYRDAFVKGLNAKGISSAAHFTNPANGMSYAYLKRYDTWQEAMGAYKSNSDYTYYEDTWIMFVDNPIEQGNETGAVMPQKTEKEREIINIPQPPVPDATVSTTALASTISAETIKRRYLEEHPEGATPAVRKSVQQAPVIANKEVKKKIFTPARDEAAKTAKAPEKTVMPKIEPTLQIAGQEEGFYIIANVFSRPDYATGFVNQLRKKGLEADYFINPANNYRYVYLKKHQGREEAVAAYNSKINNSYDDKMWIMKVKRL